MAVMYISEYAEQALDGNGNPLMVGKEPAIAKQNITFTTTVASAAFLDATTFVRISLDAAGFVNFGIAPTAVTVVDTPMAANVPEYFGVAPRTIAALAVAAVI